MTLLLWAAALGGTPGAVLTTLLVPQGMAYAELAGLRTRSASY